MRGIVYIAGPMTVGPREENLTKAIEVSEKVWGQWYAPFVPHMSFFYNDIHPHTWDEWLDYDETIIKSCCALIRVEGESKGADREVEFARQEGIPVFFTFDDFKIWSIVSSPL